MAGRTVTLANDLAPDLEQRASESGLSLDELVNQLIRGVLDSGTASPRTLPFANLGSSDPDLAEKSGEILRRELGTRDPRNS